MSPPSARTGSSRSRSRSGSRADIVKRSAISGARVGPLHPGAGHVTDAYSAEAAERAHRRVLASHLAFTQIQLPHNLPAPDGITKLTSTVEPLAFSDLNSPLLGAYSTFGDRHGSADRCEDALVALDLHFDPTRIPNTPAGSNSLPTLTNLPTSKTRFRIAALLDGHGANVPTTQRRHGTDPLPPHQAHCWSPWLSTCYPSSWTDSFTWTKTCSKTRAFIRLQWAKRNRSKHHSNPTTLPRCITRSATCATSSTPTLSHAAPHPSQQPSSTKPDAPCVSLYILPSTAPQSCLHSTLVTRPCCCSTQPWVPRVHCYPPGQRTPLPAHCARCKCLLATVLPTQHTRPLQPCA
ncbi:hypothetical protein BCR44DRAFT_1277204 [Catenaria anguillulae PL171]|uniref:Uncharacterized protein n=1 Tax=Catenaria anguillulae PL171 TaxID=765915 RepID=A0A1Y2H9C6_9FUNG|nr:hypothetical protein BCR44DRAFT_1277204 [Catenaria anguillulae PL171]